MVWEIALVIFLLSGTVVLYLLIPFLLRMRETLKHANQTLRILNKDLPDILDNVKEISSSANAASKKITTTVENLAELEKVFSKEIKEPLQNVAKALGMLLQILDKLFNRFKKQK